jgi:hypothetical protein
MGRRNGSNIAIDLKPCAVEISLLPLGEGGGEADG